MLPSHSFVREPTRCTGVWPLLCTSNFSEPYVRVWQLVRTSAKIPYGDMADFWNKSTTSTTRPYSPIYAAAIYIIYAAAICNNMHVTCMQRYWSDIMIVLFYGSDYGRKKLPDKSICSTGIIRFFTKQIATERFSTVFGQSRCALWHTKSIKPRKFGNIVKMRLENFPILPMLNHA